ncbi:hypothetical protein RB595_005170 [Gaeumannomyces hyphopodioides]
MAAVVPMSAHGMGMTAPDSPISGAELIGGVEAPSDPECNWWWQRCGPLLATLLRESGGYTADQMSDHLRVFRDLVVPTFGPRTSKARVRPLLTLDGGPFEPSWNFQAGRSAIRYAWEPLWDDAGTDENPFTGAQMPAFLPLLRQAAGPGADTRWFEQAWDAWYVSGAEARVARRALPPHLARVPQVYLGFDMHGGRRALKSYHFPAVKHLATGRPTEDLAYDLIRRLEPGGEALWPAARRVRDYLAGRAAEGPGREIPVEMMAIDNVDPADGSARVKIYARTPSNSRATLRDGLTLGGAQTDGATMTAVAHAERFWHLMLDERDGVRDNQTKEPRNPRHHHVGIVFAFEIRQGDEHVDVKAHVPWAQHNATDMRAMQNFAGILRSLGWPEHAERYEAGVLETAKLPGRNYATQAGGLCYVSYSCTQKGGDYASSYFSPLVHADHGL